MDLKAGVIGLGVMGKLHARVYSELGLLGGVCDVNPIVAEQIGKKYGVSWYSDYHELLKSDVPAVSIAVPTPAHMIVATDCLSAGCDVLLEKPIAPTLDDAKQVVDLAGKLERVLAIGYIEMYNPAFKAVKALAAAGYFGQITSVNIKRIGGIPRSADNVVLDLMTHDIGLLIELFSQDPRSIDVRKHISPEASIVDSAQALLSFDGASATCEANWVSPVKVRQMAVTGTGGYCEADLITQKLTIYRTPSSSMFPGTVAAQATAHSDPCYMSSVSFKVEPLKEELSAFLRAVEARSFDEIVTGWAGLRILDATLRAVRETRPHVST